MQHIDDDDRGHNTGGGPQPLTSAEQVASLGRIRRLPVQIDLFVDTPSVTPPKRGRGAKHVRLYDQAVIPAGMAHFAGGGPDRRYCQNCRFYGDLPVWLNGRVEKARGSREETPKRVVKDACAKAAQLFGGVAQLGGIGPCRSCKYFKEKSSDGPARPDQNDQNDPPAG
jgi:hypothetical protein